MADLKSFKLTAKERLEKAQSVPLPSPTIGVTGAFRAKTAAPAEAAPAVEDKPAPAAGQGKEKTAPPVKVEQETPAPTPAAKDKSNGDNPAQQQAPAKSPATQAGAMLTFRPLLHFSKPMLPRAEALARKLNVTVEMLVHKVANETSVEGVDFKGDDPAPRGGKVYRGSIRVPKDRAERYVAEVDPLGLHDQGTTLRPVCLRAFDRAAEKILTELERKTL